MKKKKLKNQKYMLEFGYSKLPSQISHDTILYRVRLDDEINVRIESDLKKILVEKFHFGEEEQ